MSPCRPDFSDSVMESWGVPARVRRVIRYGLGLGAVLLCAVTLFGSGISVGAWLMYDRVRADSQAEISRLQTALGTALQLAGERIREKAGEVGEAAEATEAAAVTVERAADGAAAAASAAKQAATKAGAAATKADAAAAKARQSVRPPTARPAPPMQAPPPPPAQAPPAPPKPIAPKPWDSRLHKG